MEELIVKVLADAGMVGVFALFVLYLNKGQSKERAASAKERAAFLDVLLKVQSDRNQSSAANMTQGMAALDKTTAAIRDLGTTQVELTKTLAVHDTRTVAGLDGLNDGVRLALERLDSIKTALIAR